jgi:hypothetical protein
MQETVATALPQILEATGGRLTPEYHLIDNGVLDAVTGEPVMVREDCNCDLDFTCLSLQCQVEYFRAFDYHGAMFASNMQLSRDEALDVYSDPSDAHKLASVL